MVSCVSDSILRRTFYKKKIPVSWHMLAGLEFDQKVYASWILKKQFPQVFNVILRIFSKNHKNVLNISYNHYNLK